MTEKVRVLFVCTHNAARSQMAEGYVRAQYGDRYSVCSAGTETTSVHPLAIEVMREIGIDISHHWSKHVSEFLNEKIDVVVTMCSSRDTTCPSFPGVSTILLSSSKILQDSGERAKKNGMAFDG